VGNVISLKMSGSGFFRCELHTRSDNDGESASDVKPFGLVEKQTDKTG
jgi:hypothetical protein